MKAIAAPQKVSASKFAQARGVPSILKRHALRCKPVAFKEEERIVDTNTEDFTKGVKQVNATDLESKVKTTLGHPVMAEDAVKVNRFIPAFTRRREAFVGRLGMVGFFAACLWETYLPNHPGIIAQVSDFLGISSGLTTTLFLGIIAYNTLGALGPWSPTFSPENLRDVAKRPQGPPNERASPLDFKRFWGVDAWGFTKKNEIFNGRLAMLGFAAAIFNELRLGVGIGPLAQVANFLNIIPDDGFYMGAAKALWGFTFLAVAIALLDGNLGNVEGEEDIY